MPLGELPRSMTFITALEIHSKEIVRVAALRCEYYPFSSVEKAVIGEINVVAVCSVACKTSNLCSRCGILEYKSFGTHYIVLRHYKINVNIIAPQKIIVNTAQIFSGKFTKIQARHPVRIA